MAHQVTGLARLTAAPQRFALGAEQGTGKTWMLLADAERQWHAGLIQALLVIAPRGVHINWVRREIPRHLEVPHIAEFWQSGAGKRHTAKLERLLREPPGPRLMVLAMNVDAVNTQAGLVLAERFLARYRCMMVVDESQRIKSLSALRTKRTIRLGCAAVARRIASGTLVADSPLDLFAQYEFLAPGAALLGTTSYRAFVAEYADLLPASSGLVQNIRKHNAFAQPQIVRRDGRGNPVFRNLDKLRRLLAPHTYRVLKSECLDLPDKVFQTQYFDLTSAQKALYEQVREEQRIVWSAERIDNFSAMTVLNKLRQITSGFVLREGEPITLRESAPRMEALLDVLEDAPGQVIVWASYREELRQVAAALRERDYTVVEYHGGISARDREEAVDAFQSGRARIFLGHPAAGGTGLTLTAATMAIYYSCSFSLEERMQSEDRCHRIGTHAPVVYVDLVARGTVDERIADALQSKAGVAAAILRDLDHATDA